MSHSDQFSLADVRMKQEKLLSKGFRTDVAIVMNSQEQLSYLIHDMRSITTSVTLMVDLLELAAKAEDDSLQRARAVSAQKSCEQMSSLCAEAAMVLTGSVDERFAPQKFNLLELLVEAAAMYSPIYDLAGKNLQMNATGRAPQFFGNRSQIFRSISNLLDNGLKHTSSGATVIIECSDSLGEFAVAISDDGPGLPELQLDVQRPIDTLPVVVKHLANSSGVFSPGRGLRFVSETISEHGGNSTVEISKRGGCKFTLTFQKQSNG
ncbi:MAG: HAMP domain-containing histidine kinase [Chloroflexi bacterium]|nr:HAMP domain-containing histidine kinase [Chloroflexota bacterium]